MSIFGSREDDPLLQDDPFAPDSDGETANTDRTPDPDRAGGDGAPSHPMPSDTLAGSVFEGPTKPNDASQRAVPADDGDSRVISRSVEQAAEGQLDPLNAAFDEGWRLQRVEWRDGSASDRTGSGAPNRSLSFVLYRTSS